MGERGTLIEGEVHPSVDYAKEIIAEQLVQNPHVQEAMASCAMEGNRQAEVCGETLRRLLDHEPVSDRYLMGLSLFLQKLNPPAD